MDYSKLSDFSINLLVAQAYLGDGNYDQNVEKEEVYRAGMDGGAFLPHAYFNPCNNPADAWPIIHKYGISIAFDDYEQEWVAFTKFQFDRAGWNMSLEPEIYQHNINPLRAAMIVYLMMQEGE